MPKTKIGKDSLTNLDIKNAKAKEKAYKLPDGGGLFLIVCESAWNNDPPGGIIGVQN